MHTNKKREIQKEKQINRLKITDICTYRRMKERNRHKEEQREKETDIRKNREREKRFCVVKSLGNHPKNIFHVPATI